MTAWAIGVLVPRNLAAGLGTLQLPKLFLRNLEVFRAGADTVLLAGNRVFDVVERPAFGEPRHEEFCQTATAAFVATVPRHRTCSIIPTLVLQLFFWGIPNTSISELRDGRIYQCSVNRLWPFEALRNSFRQNSPFFLDLRRRAPDNFRRFPTHLSGMLTRKIGELRGVFRHEGAVGHPPNHFRLCWVAVAILQSFSSHVQPFENFIASVLHPRGDLFPLMKGVCYESHFNIGVGSAMDQRCGLLWGLP
ncbi:MAG TPA: hypothetical protein VHM90_14215 [Phycisphaerae bacterium]|nr:hypothetical protein [Phycisphaerae bacterium]